MIARLIASLSGWGVNIAIAMTALRTNLMRSILTTLGVMIGVFSVILAVAVGAAFDFLAGSQAEAPKFLRGTGLEWLFRLMQEPRRLGKRYSIHNVRFVWIVVRAVVRGR